jgi:hypothetical protein
MISELNAVSLPNWLPPEAEPTVREWLSCLWKLGRNRARIEAKPLSRDRREHLLRIVQCFANDAQLPVQMPTETRHRLQDELRRNFTIADTEAVRFSDGEGNLLSDELQDAIRDVLREAMWSSHIRKLRNASRSLDGQHRKLALSGS